MTERSFSVLLLFRYYGNEAVGDDNNREQKGGMLSIFKLLEFVHKLNQLRGRGVLMIELNMSEDAGRVDFVFGPTSPVISIGVRS